MMRNPIDRSADLAALQSECFRALLDAREPVPQGVIGEGRFKIHRNNLFAGLIGALRSRYPVVARLVGDEFFDAAARSFIASHPPQSPALFEYGEQFANFLDDFEFAGALPYLPDAARLEWLIAAASHAADRPCLTVADLELVPPEQSAGLTFEFHPSAALIDSVWPVVSIWETNARDSVTRPIGPDLPGEAALVVRPELDVLIVRLDPGEHAFAQALLSGQTLASAADSGSADPEFSLPRAFARLLNAGAFSGFRMGG